MATYLSGTAPVPAPHGPSVERPPVLSGRLKDEALHLEKLEQELRDSHAGLVHLTEEYTAQRRLRSLAYGTFLGGAAASLTSFSVQSLPLALKAGLAGLGLVALGVPLAYMLTHDGKTAALGDQQQAAVTRYRSLEAEAGRIEASLRDLAERERRAPEEVERLIRGLKAGEIRVEGSSVSVGGIRLDRRPEAQPGRSVRPED